MLGGAAVLDTGPNRGLRFEQRLEGGEGVSHVAGWPAGGRLFPARRGAGSEAQRREGNKCEEELGGLCGEVNRGEWRDTRYRSGRALQAGGGKDELYSE